jgi:replication-associated recombination protein RarA
MDELLTQKGYNFHECLSAMQKCIRRGKEEQALFWALELESFNPKALWNRLRIIASEDVGISNNSMAILINALNRSYEAKKDLKKRDSLFIAHAILALCRSKKNRIVDNFLIVVQRSKKLKIPDYALDMHTARGRFIGRGRKHFIAEGCKLENEDMTIEDIYKERAES